MRRTIPAVASALVAVLCCAGLGQESAGTQPAAKDAAVQSTPRDRISQFGITWRFDRKYPTGRFANGDYWVVGPVKVISIDPPSVAETDGSVRNGSMLNPRAFDPASKSWQAYDSRLARYGAAVNVAKDVSADRPLAVPPGNSLVSMVSFDSANKSSPRPTAGLAQSTWALLRAAAVLTVLPSPAPAGSFRPAFSATDKRIRYTTRQLDYSVLKKLKPVAGAPDLARAERYFERPWIDHMVGSWQLEDNAPAENMPRVGTDACRMVTEASFLLNMDLPDANKERLLVRFVQTGIDLYGIVTTGEFGRTAYLSAGSHRSGRKWPILFAGIVLHDKGMKNVRGVFAEDIQVYYHDDPELPDGVRGKKGWTGATVLYGRVARGTRRPYEHKHPSQWTVDGRGKPGDPRAGSDSDRRQEAYRQCCTGGTWVGMALCARLMGAVGYWNHPVFFDYVDRVMTEDPAAFQKVIEKETGKAMRWGTRPRDDSFVGRMWDAYRKDCGPMFGARELTKAATRPAR
ncbi:MAG TPA: hypothetical protein VNA25_14335 [Phycisphaerae bacterium]|nr:hypothetical protein [Phycisphaerae bacterium]